MPQRFLRPGLTTSQRFNAVSWQAQSFYVRLLTLVDDFGRYDADSRLLRSHCFPLGGPSGQPIALTAIDNICQQLLANGLVSFYEVEAKRYLQITRWTERVRAEKSRYPEPTCEQLTTIDSKCSPSSPSPSPSPSPSTNGVAQPTAAAFRWPNWATDSFRERFGQWSAIRKSMGRRPKDWHTMFQEQLDWLEDYGADAALDILSASIRNNWQGLFPPKASANGQAKPKLPYNKREAKINRLNERKAELMRKEQTPDIGRQLHQIDIELCSL